MDIKRLFIATIVACLLSILITSIFHSSDIKSWWKEYSDDRETINLFRREGAPYPWEEHKKIYQRSITEDVDITLEYEPVYYVSKGITFSFSIEDEGIKSPSKEEIKDLIPHIYLHHEEKLFSSLSFSNSNNCSYENQTINIDKMLKGAYKYHFKLNSDDIGKWHLMILCTDLSKPGTMGLGKIIEWEERIFEVSLSEPPTFPTLGMFSVFFGVVLFFGTLIHQLYPKIEQFFGRKVFYVIIFHLVFLLLLVYFFIL